MLTGFSPLEGLTVGSQIYYNSPDEAAAVTSVTFLNYDDGTVTDPTTVSLTLFDPTGAITSYAYNPADTGIGNIIKTTTGNYSLTLDGLTVAGLYTFLWVGAGNEVQQTTPGTFRLVPLSDVGTGMQYWYTGMEELKSRLGIKPTDPTYHQNDYEMQLAIQVVTNWINNYCGRHFYQLQETRTYAPTTIWTVDIDDLVSTPSVVADTVVMLDYEGNGVYNVPWTLGQEYQLKLGGLGNTADNYNINAGGVPKPYRNLQVLTGVNGDSSVPGGGWLPWLWPYTYLNRVQITGTWGWNTVPPAVQQASLIMCVDMYKAKDAPWGVAGNAETGMIRVQSNPWVVELLKDYINFKRKAGV